MIGTHITWIQNSSIIFPNFRKRISLVAQQPVHIPNETQVLLVPTRFANGAPPFFNCLQYLHLHPTVANGRALGKPPDELIKELLGADLQVERVAAVLDADVEEAEGEQGDIGVAMVDIVDDGHGGLARGAALLGVDEVGDLEVEGEVGLVVLGATGGLDEALQLRRCVAAPASPRVPGGRSCAGRLHREQLVPDWADDGRLLIVREPRPWRRRRRV